MLKIQLFYKKDCPFCTSIEQNLIIADLLLRTNKINNCLFSIEKIEEGDRVPRLAFWRDQTKVAEFEGMPMVDDISMINLVTLRHILNGIYDMTKEERLAEIVLTCDDIYFHGEPQFYMALKQITSPETLKHYLMHYTCCGKRKNIIRRMKEIGISEDEIKRLTEDGHQTPSK